MTILTELMKQGFSIKISEMVTPDTVFPFVEEDGTPALAFHPFNYSYISNDDPFVAHEINMLRIYQNINDMASDAMAKLDKMVYQMEHKHDPKVLGFMPNVEVIENEDGSFTFLATNGDRIFSDDAPIITQEYLEKYQ